MFELSLWKLFITFSSCTSVLGLPNDYRINDITFKNFNPVSCREGPGAQMTKYLAAVLKPLTIQLSNLVTFYKVLLSSIQCKAETLDFSTHPLPRNLLKIFPPYEHKQRQHCQAIWYEVEGCRSEKVLVQPNMHVFLQYSVIFIC